MHNPAERFAGDKKVGRALLSKPENSLKQWAVPKIPASIETCQIQKKLWRHDMQSKRSNDL